MDSWEQLRHDVFKRDDYTCQYCGKRPKSLVREGGGSPFARRPRMQATLHVDHMVPMSKGGTPNAIENLVTACAECNLSKHAKIWAVPVAYCCECGEFVRKPTSARIVEHYGEPLFWCDLCRSRTEQRLAAAELYDYRSDIDIEVAAWDALEVAA